MTLPPQKNMPVTPLTMACLRNVIHIQIPLAGSVQQGTQLSFWYECAARSVKIRGLENGLPQNLGSLRTDF